MVYTKEPQKKIKRIVRYLSKNWTTKLVEEVAEELEQKFNVGVFINYGRLIGHTHEFEIYRKFKQDWVGLLCKIKLPFEKFQKPIDF